MKVINMNRHISVHQINVMFISIYALLLPFEYVLNTESGTINKYMGLLIVIISVFDGKLNQLIIKKSNLLIILWLLFGFMSILWSISFSYWHDLYSIYFKTAAMFIFVNCCSFSERDRNTVLNLYVLGGILLFFYLIMSSNVIIDPFSGRSVIEIGGGYFDPNYMAADIIIPIGYTFGNLFKKIKEKELFNAFIQIMIFLMLFYIEILSGSRGGLLAIVSMSFTIVILQLKDKKIRRKFIIILLLSLLILFAVSKIIPEQILNRFTINSLLGKNDDGGGRLILWDSALKAIVKNPIIGYGAGCTVPAIGIFYGINRASHSLYLSTILEFGILSLLVFLCLLYALKLCFKNKRFIEIGFIIGILTASVFLDALSTKFFWMFLIIVFMRGGKPYNEDI